MGAVLQFNFQFETTECAECGMSFAVPCDFMNRRRNEGGSFYCPKGHSLVFRDTENQKLKRQLEQKEKDLEWVRAQRDRAEKSRAEIERSRAAIKGQVTKIKNRVGNGVCPCCTRSFQNLARHMKTKHPEFKKETDSQ